MRNQVIFIVPTEKESAVDSIEKWLRKEGFKEITSKAYGNDFIKISVKADTTEKIITVLNKMGIIKKDGSLHEEEIKTIYTNSGFKETKEAVKKITKVILPGFAEIPIVK